MHTATTFTDNVKFIPIKIINDTRYNMQEHYNSHP